MFGIPRYIKNVTPLSLPDLGWRKRVFELLQLEKLEKKEKNGHATADGVFVKCPYVLIFKLSGGIGYML